MVAPILSPLVGIAAGLTSYFTLAAQNVDTADKLIGAVAVGVVTAVGWGIGGVVGLFAGALRAHSVGGLAVKSIGGSFLLAAALGGGGYLLTQNFVESKVNYKQPAATQTVQPSAVPGTAPTLK